MNSHLEALFEINQRLLSHIRTMSNFPVFDPQKITNDVEANIKRMTSILKSKRLTREDEDLMKMINDCSKVLHEMLLERIMLQQDSIQFFTEKEALDSPFSKSADTIDEDDDKKIKSRRLTKKQLLVLEGWFQKHKNHPYLQKDQTNLLIKSTKLSKSQVQNWYVSNN